MTPRTMAHKACLHFEALEDRLAPVVGWVTPAPVVGPGMGFDGVVLISSGGSGALLSSGRHILTAAHVVDLNGDHVPDQSTFAVTFSIPGPNKTFIVPASNVTIHPEWNGDILEANDIAVLRLDQIAPAGAERYKLYTADDEVDKAFFLVGYGATGTGKSGDSMAGGTRRIGRNAFGADGADYLDENESRVLAYDFDQGDDATDELDDGGMVTSAGWSTMPFMESMSGRGDSGGPTFIGKKIAGVVSFVNDASGDNTFSNFGDVGFVTRVSSYAQWINDQLAVPFDLILDMNLQPGGGDDLADDIELSRNGDNLRVRVNGLLVLSDRYDRVQTVTIIGSDDPDRLTLRRAKGDLVPGSGNIWFDGAGGTNTARLVGTTRADTFTVYAANDIEWGKTIMSSKDHAVMLNVEKVELDGGQGSDTIQGPDADTLWTVNGRNAGAINFNIAFRSVENLFGGSGDDGFNLYRPTFLSPHSPPPGLNGTIDGFLGNNVLSYAWWHAQVTVRIDNRTSTGLGHGFENITRFVGGPLADTLYGPDANADWDVTDANEGTVHWGQFLGITDTFSSFENLHGGGGDDRFRFDFGGYVSGTVDGHAGKDTLDFSNLPLGSNAYIGVSDGSGNFFGHFNRIDRLVGGRANDWLVYNKANTTVTPSGPGAGTLTIKIKKVPILYVTTIEYSSFEILQAY